jgi:amino acid transporter
MTAAYIWVYTLLLVIVWWFFIVARIHAYKFKNFSLHIEKITTSLMIFFIIASILWYVVIFFSDISSFTLEINKDEQNFSDFSNIEY